MEPIGVLSLLILTYGIFSGGGIILVRIGFSKTERKGVNLSQGKIFNQIKLMFQEFLQMIKIKEWVIGACLMIMGFFVFQISLKNFSLSDLRPLANINVLFVIIFSRFILKEKLRKKEVLSIIFSFCALFILIVTAQESTNVVSTPNFFVSLVILGIICVFAMLGLYVFQFKYEYMIGILNGSIFSIGTITNKAVLTEISIAGNDLTVIFGSVIFYIFLFAYGLGIFTTLVLLSSTKGRVSVMSLVSNIFSLALVIGFSVFIFNENLFFLQEGLFSYPLSFLKIFGIILAGISLILLYSPSPRN